MTILDRALRMGEAKQFKRYAKRVDAINAWEPELELLDDEELRAQADQLRERARNGESLDDLLQETFAVVREVSRRRMFSGNVGEIFVLPTGRHAIAAEYIAFVGLGPFDRFTDEVMQMVIARQLGC